MPEPKFSVLLLEPIQLEMDCLGPVNLKILFIHWMGPESYKRWTGWDLENYSDKLAWK